MKKFLFLLTAFAAIAMISMSFTHPTPIGMVKLSKECIANLDFDLVNKTGYTIKDIYVAPTTQREWGSDIMGRQFLKDGETVEISFDSGETAHKWDIYVTWDGYEADEDVYWIGFDLSIISEITLYYNEKSGKTWAETK
jgi:hypothetical protein